jgi:hypothetical protein
MNSRILSFFLPLFCFALLLSVVLVPRTAEAYPWMNRHGYNNCASCHSDPSGAGLLTEYGRAQSDLLLSTHYAKAPEGEGEGEPSRFSGALFGLAKLPSSLLLGGWIRNGYMWNTVDGKLSDKRFLQMRADLAGQVTFGHFRANASVGIAGEDSAALSHEAWVTSNAKGPHLVSREHWLGWDASDNILVRAGRLNLPFGLRNIEHTSWVRSETRTDFNQQQQHGVAVAFNSEQIRAEAMALLGNFQLGPDAYRERGLAGYAEWNFASGQGLGVSTMFAHANADVATRLETTRQAHGLFARLSWKQLAVLAETDILVASVKGAGTNTGFAGLLQADYEIVQGVHGIVTGEALKRTQDQAEWGWGAWASAAWFFFPHFDVRGDVVRRDGQGGPPTMTYLLQLHGYL